MPSLIPRLADMVERREEILKEIPAAKERCKAMLDLLQDQVRLFLSTSTLRRALAPRRSDSYQIFAGSGQTASYGKAVQR